MQGVIMSNVMDMFKIGYESGPGAGIGNAIRGVVDMHDKLTMQAGATMMDTKAKEQLLGTEYGLKSQYRKDLFTDRFGEGKGMPGKDSGYTALPTAEGWQWKSTPVNAEAVAQDVENILGEIDMNSPDRDSTIRKAYSSLIAEYGSNDDARRIITNYPAFANFRNYDPVRQYKGDVLNRNNRGR